MNYICSVCDKQQGMMETLREENASLKAQLERWERGCHDEEWVRLKAQLEQAVGALREIAGCNVIKHNDGTETVYTLSPSLVAKAALTNLRGEK